MFVGISGQSNSLFTYLKVAACEPTFIVHSAYWLIRIVSSLSNMTSQLHPYIQMNSCCFLLNRHVVFSLFLLSLFIFNSLTCSCGALPQQQQLHGLHLVSNWQQRLQPELVPERLRPAWTLQQAGFREVHWRLPATRGNLDIRAIYSRWMILFFFISSRPDVLKNATRSCQNS